MRFFRGTIRSMEYYEVYQGYVEALDTVRFTGIQVIFLVFDNLFLNVEKSRTIHAAFIHRSFVPVIWSYGPLLQERAGGLVNTPGLSRGIKDVSTVA